MRICDWSSDVCSSDLKSRATDFPFRRREKHRASSPKSNPFALSLSKGRSFFLTSQEEGRYFDKLSTNGRKGVRLAALTPGAAPRCDFIDAVQDCGHRVACRRRLGAFLREMAVGRAFVELGAGG